MSRVRATRDTAGMAVDGNRPAAAHTKLTDLVIVSGMSGAGKSSAMIVFEDAGYFCVDNLPTTLIPTFAELCAQSSRGISAIALGVDVREGEYLASMVGTLEELRARGHQVDVLFLEASDESLVRRYHETRRRHPLAGEGNVLDGIRAERLRAALIQAQRDFFGAHTYHRVDQEGAFHTVWSGDRTEEQVGVAFRRDVTEPKEAEKVDSPPQ